MNVLFLTTGTFSENAMVKRAANMAPHLLNKGHSVTIVAKNTEENRCFLPSIEKLTLILKPFTGLASELRQKSRAIRKQNPDLVYSCGWGVRNLPALLGNVSVIEHAELFSENYEASALQRKKSLLLEWISVFFADGLVLASRYLQRRYNHRDLLGLTEQLYLPYGLDNSSSATPQQIDESSEVASQDSITRVLYMGTLYESYGIFDIVRSAHHVIDEHPQIEYVILGDGPDREAAVDLANSLGVQDHIRFKGYVVDEDVLDDYLATADIFLSPLFNTVKDKARCPSKLPMYMRFQRPIVTCKIGEAVSYLGDEGFYYTPDDPESMAREIVRASKDQGAVDYDLQRISWEHLTDSFLKWLDHDLNLMQPNEEVTA